MMDGGFPALHDGAVNYSDAWLQSTAEKFPETAALDASAPRRVYLDAACEVFALVSPDRYAWATQWLWRWRWDRTKTKRYAVRNTWRDGRPVTLYMHKEVLNATGKVQPSEAHTIGDHQDGESLNNQDENLEWATVSQNRRNRKRGPR